MIDTTDLDARIITHRLRVDRANHSGWVATNQTDVGADVGQRPRSRARTWSVIAPLAHGGQIARVTVGVRLGRVRSMLGLSAMRS